MRQNLAILLAVIGVFMVITGCIIKDLIPFDIDQTNNRFWQNISGFGTMLWCIAIIAYFKREDNSLKIIFLSWFGLIVMAILMLINTFFEITPFCFSIISFIFMFSIIICL